MKIDLPVVEHTVKVLVRSPEGECVKVFDTSHRCFEIDLPDNVLEDDVEVVCCHLDECGRTVGDVVYLKEAIEKEVYSEDTPVECDEKVAKNPPDEVYHEEAVKEVKPIDLSRKARKARKQS